MDLLRRLVKQFEGFHRVVSFSPQPTAAPYLCPAGYWSIGYGFLCQKDHSPMGLDEADTELEVALVVYTAHALRLSPILGSQPETRLAAIADFIYNLGPTKYAASTLRRRVNAGDWEGAAEQLERWVWGGGRRLPGLVARRAMEASLLR